MLRLSFFCVALLTTAVTAGSGVRCSNGAFEHDCPNEDPVCCFASDGTSSGCCPVGTVCDPVNNCKPGPPLPVNDSSVAEHDVSEDVHIAVNSAVMVGGCMFVALILVFGVVYGLLLLRKRRADAAARRALLAEAPVSSDSDSEVTSETEFALRSSLASRVPVESRRDDSNVLHCCVCAVNTVNCLFIDCEHTVACFDCAEKLKRCPECKKEIRKRKKLYLSA